MSHIGDDGQLPGSDQCDQSSKPSSFLPLGLYVGCALSLEYSPPGFAWFNSARFALCHHFRGLLPKHYGIKLLPTHSHFISPAPTLFFLFELTYYLLKLLIVWLLDLELLQEQVSVLRTEPGRERCSINIC